MTVASPAGSRELFVHARPSDESSSPPIVFIHGSMDRSASFVKVARELRDLTCIRYDRRGYGRSAGAVVGGRIDQQVADLRGIIGAGPAVLVGHSLGGVIALTLACQQPDLVRAVVAYEAPMAWSEWWPRDSVGGVALARQGDGDPGEVAEQFMRGMIGDERWEGLPAPVRARRRAEGAALVDDLFSIREDPPYDPADLTVPVVAGRGSASAPQHRRAAAELASGAPEGSLVEVDGAGHGVHLSHPAEFATMIRGAVGAAAW